VIFLSNEGWAVFFLAGVDIVIIIIIQYSFIIIIIIIIDDYYHPHRS